MRAYALAMIGLLIFGMCLVATDDSYAHAYLQSSLPQPDSNVEDSPEEIVITFSEPVEIVFSTFKVYEVPKRENLLQTKAAASQLMAEVLGKRNDQNDQARADAGVSPSRGISDTITFQLKDELQAGAYVVMWRVLSIDTHQTEGFLVFTVGDE